MSKVKWGTKETGFLSKISPKRYEVTYRKFDIRTDVLGGLECLLDEITDTSVEKDIRKIIHILNNDLERADSSYVIYREEDISKIERILMKIDERANWNTSMNIWNIIGVLDDNRIIVE